MVSIFWSGRNSANNLRTPIDGFQIWFPVKKEIVIDSPCVCETRLKVVNVWCDDNEHVIYLFLLNQIQIVCNIAGHVELNIA